MRKAARRVGRGEIRPSPRDRGTDVSDWQAFAASVCPTHDKHPPPISPKLVVAPRRAEPRCLDLHGLDVREAHHRTMEYLQTTHARSVTVVTGRSGRIRQEFCRWLEQCESVHRVEELNGGGAFRVHRRKSV